MASKSSSVMLLPMALLLCHLAPTALPRSAFLGVGRAPAPPTGGAAANALGASPLPQAFAIESEPQLCIAAGTVALALATAVVARRRAAGGRAARINRKATTQDEIKELEALYRRKNRSGRGWFGFGKKEEEEGKPEPAVPTLPDLDELPEDLKALVEESRALTQRVAELDVLSSLRHERASEQAAEAKEELPPAEEVEAQPEPEVAGEQAAVEVAMTATETQVPEEEAPVVEARQELAAAEEAAAAEEPAADEEMEPIPEEPSATEEQPVLEEEVAKGEEAVVGEQTTAEDQAVAEEQDAAEVLPALGGQPPMEEQAAAQEKSVVEEPTAEVEEPTEAQMAAMALLDKQNDTLNRVLVKARELEADNKQLKEDLKAAQKLCYELLNKELDAASADAPAA